jgi:hypothetical protein
MRVVLILSKQKRPMPPYKADHIIRGRVPAYMAPTPSFCAMRRIERKTGDPGGSMPVESLVFTTSKGVVKADEKQLAQPPAIAV